MLGIACDLCHSAKQKCSGDRPSCTRCIAGGWNCNYAPRQRRRTVPKEVKASAVMDLDPAGDLSDLPIVEPVQPTKKRKMQQRDSSSFGPPHEIDMKMAMNMAVDLGLTTEEENEEMVSMTDEQMLESIAIDGYLADLPLATFVHNLPYTAGANNDNTVTFNASDFSAADMDQHTTSALRDAIFSLNESSGGHGGHGDGAGDEQGGDAHGDAGDNMDPDLALLDLTHVGDGEDGTNEETHQNGLNLGSFNPATGCNHVQMIPHLLNLLLQHGLEPKPGSNTPLSLGVFAPLSRSLRLFHSLLHCSSCLSSPQQTLPQLALLSRTTTILTFPFPPIDSSSVGSSAQISIHGARLAGTGLSEIMEQHIVGVVWDSWRASVREVFAIMERKAQDVITLSAGLSIGDDEDEEDGPKKQEVKKPTPNPNGTSAETQRAGLMFQAMTRLNSAMDEVEGTEIRGRSLF
ncbi:hypothetical protein BD324DRAFT_17532 [Kockovaella imperatae]|uniref:Zn(2)-C6 fungal-type domain-containing protein n=1 Tax=Kockovaella imperatae TaxID=4999 RepID=A0A1Y1URY1_9TREE|nr:hypothetical protein BD324DRAFT_17532 [Kockovaella imperatae]ORX40729.1 hypothetical protein BD324DRAFT_17532 [Kockovaella imperatae]